MKALLLGSVFLCFLGIGYLVWYKYKSRKVFFENLVSFCEHLLVEISFQKNTIRNIIGIYGGGYGKHFRAVLIHYQYLIDQKKDITRARVGEILNEIRFLKSNETTVLADFFCELGRHGSAEEKQKIDTKKLTFDNFFKTCVEALRKDASTYLKLFIFLGVGAVILLI